MRKVEESRKRPSMLPCVVSLLAASALSAATVHVAPEGNDANPGTAARPVATLRKAVELTTGKDGPCEIVVHKGVYRGGVAIGARAQRDGGPLPHLLITAAPLPGGGFEEAVFDGANRIDRTEPVPGKPGVFKMSGAGYSLRRLMHVWESDTRTRYTLVADLAAVERYPASFCLAGNEIFLHTSDGRAPETHDMGITRDNEGIMVWRPNTTLRGLRFRNFLSWDWSSGVVLRAPNTTAEDCHVWNSRRGIQMLDENVENMRAIRCRTDDCGGGVYVSGKRGIVEDCRFYKIRDKFMVPEYPQNDCAIQFYYPAEEGEVRRNVCVGFMAGIFMKCKVSEFVVERNTVLDGITYGIGCTAWHPKSVFRYNIVTGFQWPLLNGGGAGGIATTNVVDYNCFWDNPEPSSLERCLDLPRQAGTGRNTIVANPRFAAPASGDYRLLPDSPCAKMGPAGEIRGALGVVGADFRDTEPPSVKLSLAGPARQAGGSGELYFERDPWQGPERSLIRRLTPKGYEDRWVTPDRKVALEIRAEDNVSEPAQMKIRIGDGAWSEAAPFQPVKEVPLPAADDAVAVSVTVSDQAGNWSAPKTLAVRPSLGPPQLRGAPTVYANETGVIVSFETDVPCLSRIEYGVDRRYGATLEQPADVQRTWFSADGGEWVAIWTRPKTSHALVLLEPAVEAGKTYRYRLTLTDEVGNRAVLDDAVFVVSGRAKSWFVSPDGEDADGRGTRERPWRTIQFAVDRALPGDRAILLPGLYTGETKLTHGGREGAPIVIEAQQPGTATLDLKHEPQDEISQEAKACLKLQNAPHVVIDGLEIRWFTHSGVYAVDSPSVSVLRCRIWNAFWMGYPLGSGVFGHRSPNLTVDRCVIYRIERGIGLLQCPRSRVTFNTVLGNMYGAAQFVFSAEGTISRNNSFAYSGNDQYGIFCQDAKKEMETFDSDYNNMGTRLRADTVATGAGGPQERIEVKDDFFRNHGSKAIVSWDGKRFNNMMAWREATGQDRNSIFKDPMYADPERFDFRLLPGSPNVGAGEGGATIGALGVKEN